MKLKTTFKESLKSGGTLIVTLLEWHIAYYIPGMEEGNNGTCAVIPGSCIDLYIEAWRDNFKDYLLLKEKFANTITESLYCHGKCCMIICVEPLNLGSDGVCFGGLRINTEDKLNNLISDYEYARCKTSSFRSRLMLLRQV